MTIDVAVRVLAVAAEESRMAIELREAPEALRRQFECLEEPLSELFQRIRRAPPKFVVTCARGSSAHAATFGKHLIERHLGIAVGSAAPNIATIYRRQIELKGQLLLTISQSGKSDDLTEYTLMAKRAGALTVAIVNDAESPLAHSSDLVLPMEAGPELSVAATKSFVASLGVLLQLVAGWIADRALRDALDRLPERLRSATDLDWSPAVDGLSKAASLASIGRGPTLAIAREAALKLKETCNIYAEAFSGAEFQHGPITLSSPHYPVLVFVPNDEAAPGLEALAADLRGKGAVVFATGRRDDLDPALGQRLPALAPDHPDVDAVCLIQSFYSMVVRLAARRGADVDRPRYLRKVTRTR
jgi:glucosamine--fructose-6-phosphate aminotransferase (isomerizing)